MADLNFKSSSVKVKYISGDSKSTIKTYSNVKEEVSAEQLSEFVKYLQSLTNAIGVYGSIVTTKEIEVDE